MPNWNSNCVEISAPISEVKKYLVYDKKEKSFTYNMHILYPDVFDFSDLDGLKNWDYDWAVENTGSKWFPVIDHVFEGVSETGQVQTILCYDTARCPNNDLLTKLHEMTGWAIKNTYEEPSLGLQ